MRAWLRVGLCGALGGAIDAGHYLWWVRASPSTGDSWLTIGPTFHWHLVPAGAVHGGLLAALAFAGGSLLAKQHLAVKVLGALLLGWIAGMVSWIPLQQSLFNGTWWAPLTWAFSDKWLVPLTHYFGLVASLYCLGVALSASRKPTLGAQVLYACCAGILGSLWFWGSRWDFSLLHGTIWGICAGTGAWMALRRRAEARADAVTSFA